MLSVSLLSIFIVYGSSTTYGDPNGCKSGSFISACSNQGVSDTFNGCTGECKDGYTKKYVINECKSVTIGYCEIITCNVQNCDLCSSDNVCKTCKSGYTSDGNGGCRKITCNSPCTTCSSDNYCTECISGYKPNDGKCYYCNINNCQKCDEDNHCETCISPYIANNGRCYYCNIDNCQKCDEDNHCATCYSPYILNDGHCEVCSIEHCNKCAPYSSNNCETCESGYIKNLTSNLFECMEKPNDKGTKHKLDCGNIIYDINECIYNFKTIAIGSEYYFCHYTDSECENMDYCSLRSDMTNTENCKVSNGMSSTLILFLSIILMITI